MITYKFNDQGVVEYEMRTETLRDGREIHTSDYFFDGNTLRIIHYPYATYSGTNHVYCDKDIIQKWIKNNNMNKLKKEGLIPPDSPHWVTVSGSDDWVDHVESEREYLIMFYKSLENDLKRIPRMYWANLVESAERQAKYTNYWLEPDMSRNANERQKIMDLRDKIIASI